MNDRGRYLGAVAQIRLDEHDADAPPWAAIPLWEGNLELALTWLRNNHETLVQAGPGREEGRRMSTQQGWKAVFMDGPAEGSEDREFIVGPIWKVIRLVRMPANDARPEHWAIVGGDSIDIVGEERVPWEGEVTYHLSHTAHSADESVAYYTAVP